MILGLIVIIRTVLSISIQIEIEGTLPWRRALLTSGGESDKLHAATLAAEALETESERWKAVGMKFAVHGLSEKKVAQLRG